MRAQQYRDQSRQRLTGLLGQQAQQQRADQEAFSREKAALLEGSERNNFGASQSINNGIAGGASILGSRSGGGGYNNTNPSANGAIDAMAPNMAVLGPTGQPSNLPPASVGYYNPLGQPPRMRFQTPFAYGRY